MTDDALSSLARWEATVTYRHDFGPVEVPMLLRELSDLHDRIECGPRGRSPSHRRPQPPLLTRSPRTHPSLNTVR
jgi:hypothetical protein